MENGKGNGSDHSSVTVTKTINADVETVFLAWIKPELISQWLAPGGCNVQSVSNDPRPGGDFRLIGSDVHGAPYEVSGRYISVEPNKHISLTWTYVGPATALRSVDTIVSVSLRPTGSRTEVVVTHERCGTAHSAELNGRNWTHCLQNLSVVAASHAVPQSEGSVNSASSFYRSGQRHWQQRFDSEALADRLHKETVKPYLTAADAAFIAHQNMFFLATTDADGFPNCSYKGGPRGFVQVQDEATLQFPTYDGNGMFLSVGNITDNNNVALLFVDFERQARLRILGTAEVVDDERALRRLPGADLIVRVYARAVFRNCPRYVHRMVQKGEASDWPDADGDAPVAKWKKLGIYADVLPERDAHLAGSETDDEDAMNRS